MATTLQDDKSVRQAFEVEQIATRRNYTFEWDPILGKLIVWDTSRGVGKKYFDEDNTDGAWDRFKDIYQQSLRNFQAPFLGWVNPDTIEPLDE